MQTLPNIGNANGHFYRSSPDQFKGPNNQPNIKETINPSLVNEFQSSLGFQVNPKQDGARKGLPEKSSRFQPPLTKDSCQLKAKSTGNPYFTFGIQSKPSTEKGQRNPTKRKNTSTPISNDIVSPPKQIKYRQTTLPFGKASSAVQPTLSQQTFEEKVLAFVVDGMFPLSIVENDKFKDIFSGKHSKQFWHLQM